MCWVGDRRRVLLHTMASYVSMRGCCCSTLCGGSIFMLHTFIFGGILIDCLDIGLHGRTRHEDGCCYCCRGRSVMVLVGEQFSLMIIICFIILCISTIYPAAVHPKIPRDLSSSLPVRNMICLMMPRAVREIEAEYKGKLRSSGWWEQSAQVTRSMVSSW